MSPLRACLPLALAACHASTVLDAPVDVVVDANGIPHVFASTVRDAYWGHGYAVASQRMFQMELLRRRAWGTRAEILGEDYLDSDVQSRALRFGPWGKATAEALAEEDPELYGLCMAYVDGINAYLAAVDAGTETLSEQWAATGATPTPWKIEDTFAVEKLLTAGLGMRPTQDLTLGLLATLVGEDLFADLYTIPPFDRDYILPDFYAGEAAASRSVPSAGSEPTTTAPPDALLRVYQWARKQTMALGGSNNQAIAGQLTESGHALLASDSHQGVRHPATYWLVHMNTRDAGGELDIAGATFPGVPFVLFGATQSLAFGPTTSLYDVSDAWSERWATDGVSVVTDDGDVPVERYDQTVKVRPPGGAIADATEVPISTYVVPHHGPILPTESLGLPIPLLVSVGWTGYSATSGARAFLDLSTAQDVEEGVAALQGYLAGGMHWGLADTTGRVAYTSPTRLPVREVLDPSHPPYTLLPGQGGYEWKRDADGELETVPLARIPQGFDPADGLVITANNDPVGATDDGDPFNEPVFLAGVFDIGTRSWLPRKLLTERASAAPLTLDDAQAVQTNTLSRLSERFLPFLFQAAERRPDLVDARMAEALAVLGAWDHRCTVDQAAPTLFHAWLVHTSKVVLADENSLMSGLLFDDMDYQIGLVVSKFLIRWLEATEANIDDIEAGRTPFPSQTGRNYFDDQTTEGRVETRDEDLLTALRLSLDELARLFPDSEPQDVAWGRWHVIRLEDPAEPWLPSASSEALPKDGCLYTIDVGDVNWLEGGELPAQLAVTNAPSNRFLWELDPDGVAGKVSLPGGQSEDPASPFHNSLLQTYVDQDYVDMIRERSAIVVDQTVRFGADGMRSE